MMRIPLWEDLTDLEKYDQYSQHNMWQVSYLDDTDVFIVDKFHIAGSRDIFKVDTVEGHLEAEPNVKRYMIPESLKLHPVVKKRLEKEAKEQRRLERIRKKKEKARLKKEKEKAKLKAKRDKENALKVAKQKAEKLSKVMKKWTCQICNKKYSPKSKSYHLNKEHDMSLNDYKNWIMENSGKLNI